MTDPAVLAGAAVAGMVVLALALGVLWSARDWSARGLLRDAPWETIQWGIERARRRFFTVGWKESAPSVRVNMSPEELDRVLRERYGFEGTPYTYKYEGEVLNMRTPWGLDDDGDQLELHIRARPLGDGRLEVIGHTEKSRYEHKGDHINGVGLDWKRGYEEFEAIWRR